MDVTSGRRGSAVSRPSAEEIKLALVELAEARAGDHKRREWATRVLREALKPRPVWPAKEVAEALSTNGYRVAPSNLNDVRGLPAPAQELPRPTVAHPDKVMRLWYADEIVEFAAARPPRAGRRADG